MNDKERKWHHIVVIDERTHIRWNVANVGPVETPWIVGRADGRGDTTTHFTLTDALITLSDILEPTEQWEGRARTLRTRKGD